MVLISTSYVDDLLLRTITAFLVEGTNSSSLTTGMSAPLGSLAARAQMACCLGLITDSELREITNLRRIRNEFAHSHTADFDNDRIRDLCGNLVLAGFEEEDAQDQFLSAVLRLIMNLSFRPEEAGQHRLRAQHWPP